MALLKITRPAARTTRQCAPIEYLHVAKDPKGGVYCYQARLNIGAYPHKCTLCLVHNFKDFTDRFGYRHRRSVS